MVSLSTAPLYDEQGQITSAVGIFTDITERNAAEQDRKRRMAELEALEEISSVVRSGEKRGEVLPVVLDRMMEVFDAQGVSIACLDSQNGDLVIEMGRGVWVNVSGTRVPAGTEIDHRVAADWHYYLNNHIQLDPNVPYPHLANRVDALLCLALIVKGETVGLLYLGLKNAFRPADVRLAVAAVDILASALHRLELYE